jgi:YesN/AraC family two-component response regulator
MTGMCRILLADDHDVVRRGLRTLLESKPGFEVCGEARTGREAVAKTQELKPDVIVMDISMP